MIPAPYVAPLSGLRLLGHLDTQRVPQHWHSQGRHEQLSFRGPSRVRPAAPAPSLSRPISSGADSDSAAAAYHDASARALLRVQAPVLAAPGRPIGQHVRLQLLRQPKAGSGRALSGAQVLSERCGACRPATNLATAPLGGNMPSVRPTVSSPSPGGIAQRATVGGPLAEWHVLEVLLLDGRTRAAGWPAKPIPLVCFRPQSRCHGRLGLYDSDRDSDCGLLQYADHTHNGDHVQQVIESTHSQWAPIQFA
jgi:hypothetical protein